MRILALRNQQQFVAQEVRIVFEEAACLLLMILTKIHDEMKLVNRVLDPMIALRLIWVKMLKIFHYCYREKKKRFSLIRKLAYRWRTVLTALS